MSPEGGHAVTSKRVWAAEGKDDAVGHDDLDSRVHDRVALDEIALYAEVLTAVAVSERRLTLDELDDALGLRTSASR
jgi:hypothetical protein